MTALKPPTSPDRSLGETLDVLRLLWAVDHAMHRTSKVMERDLGVTGPQRLIVRIVGRFPGVTSGEVARIIDAHPSTVTGLVKRLRRRGLLRVDPDLEDGRRVRLALTPLGREVDHETPGTIEAAIQATIQTVGGKRMAVAMTVMRELWHQLGRERSSPVERRSR